MGVSRYLVVRSLNAFLTLAIITLLISWLFGAVTDFYTQQYITDYIRSIANDPNVRRQFRGNETALREYLKAEEQRLMSLYGLDKPFIYRVFLRTWMALTFDFGKTARIRALDGSRDVSKVILERLPRTILLFTTATIINILVGVYLGLKAALRAGSMADRTVALYALISNSVPMWWTGMLMILAFSYYLDIFPSGGLTSLPPPPMPYLIVDMLWHLALPVFTVVLVSFGGWAYVVRNVVIDVIHEDFVLVARAKGLPENIVIYRHVLRAAAPPIVTMIILSLLGSLGGAIITETVFNYPGMGMLYWTAIEQNDLPVIIGLGYIFTFLFVLGMLLADLLYGFLDPRVKVGW